MDLGPESKDGAKMVTLLTSLSSELDHSASSPTNNLRFPLTGGEPRTAVAKLKRKTSEAGIAFQDEDTGRTEGQEPTIKVGGGACRSRFKPKGDRASGQLTRLSLYRIDLVQRHTR